jgi:hypothetical protein
MATETKTTWDLLDEDPLTRNLDAGTRLAVVCEYLDFLKQGVEGVDLSDFIREVLSPDEPEATAPEPPAPEPPAPEPAAPTSVNGAKSRSRKAKVAEPPPAASAPAAAPAPAAPVAPAAVPVGPDRGPLLGKRVVYRIPGNTILSDAAGVTAESYSTVAFTDVEGGPWTNVSKDKVAVIDPANTRVIRVAPREYREIEHWLAGHRDPSSNNNEVLRHFFVEFPMVGDRLVLAIVNDEKPYVDRYVHLSDKDYEDEQRPTSRLLGEHCFRRKGVDYIVRVESP